MQTIQQKKTGNAGLYVFLALRLQLRLASNIRDFVCVDDCRNGNSVFMGKSLNFGAGMGNQTKDTHIVSHCFQFLNQRSQFLAGTERLLYDDHIFYGIL